MAQERRPSRDPRRRAGTRASAAASAARSRRAGWSCRSPRRRGPGSLDGGSWRPASRAGGRARASRRAAADAGPSLAGSGTRSFGRQRLHGYERAAAVVPVRRRPAPSLRPMTTGRAGWSGARTIRTGSNGVSTVRFGSGHMRASWPRRSSADSAATPTRVRGGRRPGQPSYSKPILTSTWYSTISPSADDGGRLHDLDRTMLRTVFEAVATAWRAASLHELRARADHLADDDDAHGALLLTLDWPPHDDTRPTRFRAGLVAAQGIRRVRRTTVAGSESVPARTLSKQELQ